MELSVKEIDRDIRIVIISGKVDTTTSPMLETKLNELIEGNVTKFLINFQNVSYISSAGLRVLLTTAKKLKTTAGQMRICCLNEVVQEIFEISGFGSILSVFKTEDEAIGNF